jgi:hypothetical protein
MEVLVMLYLCVRDGFQERVTGRAVLICRVVPLRICMDRFDGRAQCIQRGGRTRERQVPAALSIDQGLGYRTLCMLIMFDNV